ncbi:MAG: hypothetical protein OEY44_04285 [Candidatus Peregrinibacteria bacterium]|nr:hypothetical protein [Candidatus Peregrinibacteria bacterium]
MKDVLRPEREEGFYFLNEGALRERVRFFQEHFLPDDPRRRITYAVKANPRKRILEIMADEGIDGFDCASLNEIRDAASIASPEELDIHYNHPIKKRTDIEAAYLMGVNYFTAQSRAGIDKILDATNGPLLGSPEIAIRVATSNQSSQIKLSEKYGCSAPEAVRLLEYAEANGARPALAMNMGSQNEQSKSYSDGVDLLTSIAKKVGGVHSINLGGGMPVNYSKRDHFELENFLREMSSSSRRRAAELFGKKAENPRIISEAGRSKVAEAIDLAIPVLERGIDRIYFDDGVFGSFSDAAVHKWPYYFEVFMQNGRRPSAHKIPLTVYGNTCDSGDTLGQILLPRNIRPGDYLWVRNAGAYMDCQASRFNGLETASYISYNI